MAMNISKVPQIFSRRRRVLRYERAFKSQRAGTAARWLVDDMVEEILDRVAFMNIAEGRAFINGGLTDALARGLGERGIETSEGGPDSVNEEVPWNDPFFPYIFSMQTLDTINDLPGALLHYRNALPEGGLFIGQMPGAGSAPALRQIMLAADGDRPAARIHPQVDNRGVTGLLERAGFKRQVVDSRTLTVRFSSFDRMIRDLREQALTSVLISPAPYVGKAGFQRAIDAFDALREDDGKVTETFEILTLTGWR